MATGASAAPSLKPSAVPTGVMNGGSAMGGNVTRGAHVSSGSAGLLGGSRTASRHDERQGERQGRDR